MWITFIGRSMLISLIVKATVIQRLRFNRERSGRRGASGLRREYCSEVERWFSTCSEGLSTSHVATSSMRTPSQTVSCEPVWQMGPTRCSLQSSATPHMRSTQSHMFERLSSERPKITSIWKMADPKDGRLVSLCHYDETCVNIARGQTIYNPTELQAFFQFPLRYQFPPLLSTLTYQTSRPL